MPVVSIGWRACDWAKIFSHYLQYIYLRIRQGQNWWHGVGDLIKARIATYHFGKRSRFLPPKIYDPDKRMTKTKKGSKTIRWRSSPYREPLLDIRPFLIFSGSAQWVLSHWVALRQWTGLRLQVSLRCLQSRIHCQTLTRQELLRLRLYLWGSGCRPLFAWCCFDLIVNTVRKRSQPFATVRNRSWWKPYDRDYEECLKEGHRVVEQHFVW